MTPKTSESAGAKSGRARRRPTPGQITVLVLGVLGLVFIFENTKDTQIRLLIPVVTMPLWMALLGTGVIGFLCGFFSIRRRR
ncbi:LapA family protein [Streptomyces mangrovisoli]|uniref:DUF1049 domain-containing protein n=1 Tax=Streptomyces mangrovisoli TaxID=1428628 RepID=A0A1J4P0W6_9ACTN|nr:LapA family protein [Streptomyces mangrovisoli]OIJ67874.1 DUF1049 domain-containing protein [Streptomyces mangrovisoli]